MLHRVSSDSIQTQQWKEAIADATQFNGNGVISFEQKGNTITVFNPKNEKQMAKYPHFSIQEISDISQRILIKTEEPHTRSSLQVGMEKLISFKFKKAQESMEKTHATWVNGLKWTAYASLIFFPVGLFISWKQDQAEKELETIKNLEIARILSENTYNLKETKPEDTFKSILKNELEEEKIPLKTAAGENQRYMVPRQVSLDLLRWPMLRLNGEAIYSNFSSSLKSTTAAYDKLIEAFGETIESHPLTDAALSTLTQAAAADIIGATMGWVDDKIYTQTWKNSCCDVNIYKNSNGKEMLALELKGLSYQVAPELGENIPITARAVSRKIEMPLSEFKEAIETKNLDKIENLKARDRISDDLFTRRGVEIGSTESQFIETKPTMLGAHQPVKKFSELELSSEAASQILENFNPYETAIGEGWDLKENLEALKDYGQQKVQRQPENYINRNYDELK